MANIFPLCWRGTNSSKLNQITVFISCIEAPAHTRMHNWNVSIILMIIPSLKLKAVPFKSVIMMSEPFESWK